MEIKVGRYTLMSDMYCMWIMEEYYLPNRGDGDGAFANRKVAGYSFDFNSLMKSFMDRKVRVSGAKELDELLADLHQIYDDMLAFRDAAVREDFKKLDKKAGRTR